MVAELIRRLLASPVLVAKNLPSTAQVTLMEQNGGEGNRLVVHLLHYPLTRRAPNLDIIEEPGLLKDVQVGVAHPGRAAASAPGRRMAGPAVPARKRIYANFTVPFVEGHQAIVVEI